MKQVERYAREIVPAFNAYFYFRIAHRASDATVVLVINHRSNMGTTVLAGYYANSIAHHL
jgi:hypothetical protein